MTTTFNKEEIIQLCKQDINFFAALCLGDIYKAEFPDEYKLVFELISSCGENVAREDFKFDIGFPRGHAKTTFMKVLLAWLLLFTHRKYALVACSNQGKANSFISDVIRMFEAPNVAAVFGRWNVDCEKDTLDLKIFKFHRKIMVLHAVGAGGDPRGYNVASSRPDIQICDDLQSRDNAKSEVESPALMEWYASTYMLTKSPDGMLHVYIGNMYPYEGCILAKLKTNPDYISFIVGAILADGHALWEEVYSKTRILADLQSAINLGETETFFSELMNDSNSVASLGFDYSKLRKWDKDDSMMADSGFIVVDPSGFGKNSDNTAIGAFLVYDEIPHFRKCIATILDPKQMILKAVELAIEFNISTVFIEGVAYQKTASFWFNKIIQDEHIDGVRALPVQPRPGSKNVRISDSLRALQNNKIILHPDVISYVLSEIKSFDPTKSNNRDDVLDLLDYSMEIPVKFPYDINLILLDWSNNPVTTVQKADWELAPV
jgi:hypothetical protein